MTGFPGLFCLFFLLIISPLSAYSEDSANTIDTAIIRAATFYSIDPDLLRAIAVTESELNPRALGDHGQSYGMFQINKFWLDRYGIPGTAMFDPNINAMWGAFVLSKCMDRYPDNFWRSVGCYNARSEPMRIRYAWRVSNALAKIKKHQ